MTRGYAARRWYGGNSPGSPVDALRVDDAERATEWRRLLGLSGGITATSAAPPAIGAQAGQLLSCLPASGSPLRVLAERLGRQLVE